jgi:hypothetical protein
VPDLQYLVIDGGSSDETVGILKEYGDRLSFISERDEGTADAIMVEHLGYVPTCWIANYAGIKSEKLVHRSGNELAFLSILVMHCLLTDLHWNKKISSSTLHMLGGWVFGRLRRP